MKSPYVFLDSAGAPYTSAQRRDRVGKVTKAAMVAAGIEGRSFIHLRHTAASLMVQAGVPLFEVQQILGHSTPAMTQRYAHLRPEHLRGAVQALDLALSGTANQTATCENGAG